MDVVVAVTKYVVAPMFAAATAAMAYGSYLQAKKQAPFDATACAKAGCRHVKSRDGRVVAYYVFGSQKADAKVMVFVHGMGDEGSLFLDFIPVQVLERLNVRGIAPALPGHGFSDMQIGRRIGNWPRDDLEPILEKEGVSKFMVQGISLGSTAALACGAHFPSDRCVGIGVITPFLSFAALKEAGLPNKTAEKTIPGPDYYDKFQNAWIFALYSILHGPVACFFAKMSADGKKAQSLCPQALGEMLPGALSKSKVRGTAAILVDELSDTPRHWGFDPRDITTKNVAVWYAKDDTGAVTPEEGQWLSEWFSKRDGVKTHILSEGGIGHFTYLTKEFIQKGFQTEALLEMAGDW